MKMELLNAGCGTHYARGWVNTDVWENDTTKPDIRVEPGKPYPFEDNHFDAVFMGHVIEHIDWLSVKGFIYEMSRMAKPGAPMLIVGPDVYRAIQRWSEGKEPWWMVESVLEHQEVAPEHLNDHEWWDGATHHWNCHEKRVLDLVLSMGFPRVEVVSEQIPTGDKWTDPEVKGLVWPVVGKAPWQFGIRIINKD